MAVTLLKVENLRAHGHNATRELSDLLESNGADPLNDDALDLVASIFVTHMTTCLVELPALQVRHSANDCEGAFGT